MSSEVETPRTEPLDFARGERKVGLVTVAVLPARVRPMLEAPLPEWLQVHWWETPEQLVELAPLAEIGWFDLHEKAAPLQAIAAARGLRWLNTNYAGVDWMPLDDLARRQVQLTCGSGLTAVQVAEFAVMSMLTVAKGYCEVVRAQDRHEWLPAPPGIRNLAGSRALLLGHGAIGQAIADMLGGFGVDIVPVSSRSTLDWRAELGCFDWIVLSLPGTPQTRGMIGAAELAAMREDAVLVNFGRADTLDQDALVEALRGGGIGAAVLDLTDPEPLPPGHVLWTLPNAHITMHLSGIPTPDSQRRAADRFMRNCDRLRKGEALEAAVDLAKGY